MPDETLTTQAYVARSLGVDARSIREWRTKFSDAPAKIDGKEPLDQWKAFYEAHSIELHAVSKAAKESMEDLKIQEQKQKVIRLEKQNREYDTKHSMMIGEWIPREEVEKQIEPLVAEFISLLKDRDTELSNWAPGHSTGEIRAHQRQTLDVMFQRIREGTTGFIESAQKAGKTKLANEPTTVNAPGAGRPKEAGSRRSKKAVKKTTTKRKKK